MAHAPDSFEEGLRRLESGAFWDAHEAWEGPWKALPLGSARREALQALIQFAAACHKLVQADERPEAGMQRGMGALIASAHGHLAAAAVAEPPSPAWDLGALHDALDSLSAVRRRWSEGTRRSDCLDASLLLARRLVAELRTS